MPPKTDYSFVLQPKSKCRYNAGAYDPATQRPRFQYALSAPSEQYRDQIDVNQFLMGSPDSRLWVWDFHNKTTWPVFVKIFKDGELVRPEDS
jgi:hypothetical protein